MSEAYKGLGAMGTRPTDHWDFGPNTEFSARHDGIGWLIRADRPGREPFSFGAYAATANDAHWVAGEVARATGATLKPLPLN